MPPGGQKHNLRPHLPIPTPRCTRETTLMGNLAWDLFDVLPSADSQAAAARADGFGQARGSGKSYRPCYRFPRQ